METRHLSMSSARCRRRLLLLLLGLAMVVGASSGAPALAPDAPDSWRRAQALQRASTELLEPTRRLESGGEVETEPLLTSSPPTEQPLGGIVAAPAEVEHHSGDHGQHRPFVIPVVGVLLAVGFMFVAGMAVRRNSSSGNRGERVVRLGRSDDDDEDDAELGLMAGARGEREDSEQLETADRHSVGVMY